MVSSRTGSGDSLGNRKKTAQWPTGLLYRFWNKLKTVVRIFLRELKCRPEFISISSPTCKNACMNLPTNFALATFGLGIIGTFLGITNFIRALISDRVRLRIRCYPLAIINPGNVVEEICCVEVVNLSSFPVTLKEVALEPPSPFLRRHRERFVNMIYACRNGERLPVRIDPRDSVQVYYKNKSAMEMLIKQSHQVIAETACGKICYGSLRKYHDIIERCERNALKEDKQAAV
jgi:hypothetical protein